jgi:epsilon-lactone hydrolase
MDGEKAYDPRYSTVLDNFEGRDFPPTMVQVGSKEIQMSDGIRLYGVLRSAGHEVELDVHDAMQHCFHGHWGTPGAAEAVRRVAEFFEKHLSAK